MCKYAQMHIYTCVDTHMHTLMRVHVWCVYILSVYVFMYALGIVLSGL